MKTFFDEDNGTGIPRALVLLRMPDTEVHFPSDKFQQVVRKGTPDAAWIPIAGFNGWLVVSQNKHMLENEAERALLVEHAVGAVFIETGRANSHLVMRLLLNKWEWLRLVDSTIERPFAFVLSLSGKAKRVI